MAINTYPAVASPVKSIQRGSAAGAGSITVTTIVPSKSTLQVFGTASSGTVAASFGLNAPGAGNTTIVGNMRTGSTNFYATAPVPGGSTGLSAFQQYGSSGGNAAWQRTVAVNAGTAPTPNAGSNNLVAAVVSGYISDATTIVVSGACRWELVEYN